ncbi:hypothetical protein D3C76_1261900 [compost metagenome]
MRVEPRLRVDGQACVRAPRRDVFCSDAGIAHYQAEPAGTVTTGKKLGVVQVFARFGSQGYGHQIQAPARQQVSDQFDAVVQYQAHAALRRKLQCRQLRGTDRYLAVQFGNRVSTIAVAECPEGFILGNSIFEFIIDGRHGLRSQKGVTKHTKRWAGSEEIVEFHLHAIIVVKLSEQAIRVAMKDVQAHGGF